MVTPNAEEGIMDQFTTVQHQGYFQRVKSSFAGIIIGLILFVVSFVVLWKNEGNLVREKVALKELAANTVEASTDEITAATAGKPVHLVGELLATDMLGDPGYLVPGDYLKLRRHAQMFQWVEDKKTETREKMGGGTEQITTYSYKKKWISGRIDSSEFRNAAGHENPEPFFQDEDFVVSESTFGAWDGLDVLEHVWPSDELELTDDMIDQELAEGERVGSYLYYRNDPASRVDTIGDERISWSALFPGTFSVIAFHAADDRLVPFVASNGKDKFLVESGVNDIAGMIETEKSAQSLLAWVFRIVGFALMWIGLGLILAPLATLLSIIPVAASISRFMIGIITFTVSLGLTVITVVISWVAHNPIVLGVAIAAGVAAALWWLKRRSATAVATSAA